MDDRIVLVVGDDTPSRQLKAMLAGHNMNVLSAGLMAGLPLDRAIDMCIPLNRGLPQLPAPLTERDTQALSAAEAKRERRAAKRQARAAQLDGGQGERS